MIPEDTQNSLVSRHESVSRDGRTGIYAMHPAFIVLVVVNLPEFFETVASDGVIELDAFKSVRKNDRTFSYGLWNAPGIPNPTIPRAIIASAKSDSEVKLHDIHTKN
jgi:hypothetical protein